MRQKQDNAGLTRTVRAYKRLGVVRWEIIENQFNMHHELYKGFENKDAFFDGLSLCALSVPTDLT